MTSTSDLTRYQIDLIRGIPDRYPPARIDRLWIFPPQIVRSRESGFVVLSLLNESESSERRTLITLRYEADLVDGKPYRQERVEEEGQAPAERIERVIAGVMARSGDTIPDPIVEEIGGEAERWLEVSARLGIHALT